MAIRRTPIALTLLASATLAIAGCTPESDPEGAASPPPPPAEETSTPIPYAVPTPGPAEVARAVYELVDGVSSTDTTLSDGFTADDRLTVRGQCDGDGWMTYALRDSRPEGDGATLTSGTLRCGSTAPQGNTMSLGLDGTVQVVLTVEPGTERAWVTVEK